MNDRRDSMTDRILASRANIPRGALQNKKAVSEYTALLIFSIELKVLTIYKGPVLAQRFWRNLNQLLNRCSEVLLRILSPETTEHPV